MKYTINSIQVFVLSASLAFLSACTQEESSISDAEIQSATEASAPVNNTTAPAFQTLTDNSQRINITLPQLFEHLPMPEKTMEESGDVQLIAQDSSTDTTIYITEIGAVKKDNKEYFNDLSLSIKSQSDYINAKAGIPTASRMNYQFSRQDNDNTINESCLAIINKKTLFTVCAVSPKLSFTQLNKFLTDIKLADSQ